jgi:hypothetical protein
VRALYNMKCVRRKNSSLSKETLVDISRTPHRRSRSQCQVRVPCMITKWVRVKSSSLYNETARGR